MQSLIIIVVITLNIIAVTEHRSLTESVLPLKLTFTMQLFENYPKKKCSATEARDKEVTPTEWGNTPTAFIISDN